MPPNNRGLYPVPRHHVYRASASQRRTFNALDFAEADAADAETMAGARGEDASGGAAPQGAAEDTKPKRKSKKHRLSEGNSENGAVKSKKHRTIEGNAESTVKSKEAPLASFETTSATVTKEEAAAALAASSPSTKARRIDKEKEDAASTATPQTPIKKRKRSSKVAATTPQPSDLGTGFLIGEDFVKEIESAMKGIGERFIHEAEQPEKKKRRRRSDNKGDVSNLLAVTDTSTAGKQLDFSTENASVTLMGSPLKKQKVTKTKGDVKETAKTDSKKPVASPTKKPVASPTKKPVASPTKKPLASPTKKPFPPLTGKTVEPAPQKILVSILKKTGASPLKQSVVPLSPKLTSSVNESVSPSKGVRTVFRSPIPLPPPRQPSSSAPPATAQDLTTPNLQKATMSSTVPVSASKNKTQPLSGEPKVKPPTKDTSRGKSSPISCSETSSSSSGSSDDIPLANIYGSGKPYSRSGAYIDPFVTKEKKKVKYRETHDETPLDVFTKSFASMQKHVNFTHEQEYLDQYEEWHSDHDSDSPIPCLGRGSGCNAKREETLRASKEQDVDQPDLSVDKSVATTGGDQLVLQEASQRAVKAEELLKMAIRARIPVPIGRVEGKWTLYNPKYSVHHYDKYGYGGSDGRTMMISSYAGFEDTNTYTARLSIPPRPVCFVIKTFSVPPHASFRTTIFETVSEGYKMHVIFLGNGFLHLRVDLNLLLKGKPSEMVGGKKVWMEFLGVHEKAVEWVEKKDELEEFGKKVFAKYGGLDDYD